MSTTTPAPARPEKLRTVVDRSGQEIRVRYRSRGAGKAAFILLWLIGWTVGCVFLAGHVRDEPTFFNVLFAIPFWASWLFVFFLLIKLLFQIEELTVGFEELRYSQTVFVELKRRTVPICELRDFAKYTTVVDSENNQTESGLEVRTLGKPIRLFQGLPDDELNWLEFQLNELAHSLRTPSDAISPFAMAQQVAQESEQQKPEQGQVDSVFTLVPQADKTLPPSDCTWTKFDDLDEFGFARRGRLSLAAVLGLLFVCAFWNGIVGVFIANLWGFAPVQQPQGAEWWGLFFFLIPFQAIGLVFILALLAALAEPIHHTRWTFSRHEIALRNTWLGVGPRKSWQIEQLDRVELHTVSAKDQSANLTLRERLASKDVSFRLSFIDRENREVCSVKGLTEGEGRWIGQEVLRKRSAWFR